MVSDRTMRPSLRSVYFVLFLAMGVLLLGSCIVRKLCNQIFTIQRKSHKIEVKGTHYSVRLSHLQHIYRPSAAALGRFCIKTKYADIYKDNSTDKCLITKNA